MIELCCEKHEVGERNSGPIKKLQSKVQLGRERKSPSSIRKERVQKVSLVYFACNKTGWPKDQRRKQDNTHIGTLQEWNRGQVQDARNAGRWCRSRWCKARRKVRAGVPVKEEEEEVTGKRDPPPCAGRRRGWLTSSADSHSFPIPYLAWAALSTTFLQHPVAAFYMRLLSPLSYFSVSAV